MKNSAFFTVVLLSALFALYKTTAAEEIKPPEPCIRFDQEWRLFDEINEGEKTSHIFKVENAGNADLVIRKVNVSCGCTLASISSKTVKPGKTALIKTVFNSKGFPGQVAKFIYVDSNDPRAPHKTLVIAGMVRPSSPSVNISMDPQQWRLDSSGRFSVWNRSRNELKVRLINISGSPYEVSIPPLSAPSLKMRPYKVLNAACSPYEAVISPQGYISPVLKMRPGVKGKIMGGVIMMEIAVPFTKQ